jgi:hypothetical protein
VVPSGRACATRAVPMVPPAPETFSTTTLGTPSGARSRAITSATSRATASVGPPAG